MYRSHVTIVALIIVIIGLFFKKAVSKCFFFFLVRPAYSSNLNEASKRAYRCTFDLLSNAESKLIRT